MSSSPFGNINKASTNSFNNASQSPNNTSKGFGFNNAQQSSGASGFAAMPSFQNNKQGNTQNNFSNNLATNTQNQQGAQNNQANSPFGKPAGQSDGQTKMPFGKPFDNSSGANSGFGNLLNKNQQTTQFNQQQGNQTNSPFNNVNQKAPSFGQPQNFAQMLKKKNQQPNSSGLNQGNQNPMTNAQVAQNNAQLGQNNAQVGQNNAQQQNKPASSFANFQNQSNNSQSTAPSSQLPANNAQSSLLKPSQPSSNNQKGLNMSFNPSQTNMFANNNASQAPKDLNPQKSQQPATQDQKPKKMDLTSSMAFGNNDQKSKDASQPQGSTDQKKLPTFNLLNNASKNDSTSKQTNGLIGSFGKNDGNINLTGNMSSKQEPNKTQNKSQVGGFSLGGGSNQTGTQENQGSSIQAPQSSPQTSQQRIKQSFQKKSKTSNQYVEQWKKQLTQSITDIQVLTQSVISLQQERELNYIASKNFKTLDPILRNSKSDVGNALEALEKKQESIMKFLAIIQEHVKDSSYNNNSANQHQLGRKLQECLHLEKQVEAYTKNTKKSTDSQYKNEMQANLQLHTIYQNLLAIQNQTGRLSNLVQAHLMRYHRQSYGGNSYNLHY